MRSPLATRRSLLTIAAVAVVGVSCSPAEGPPQAGPVTLTARALEEPPSSLAASPSPPRTPKATHSPPRDPTDTDRARFVATYRPGGTSHHRSVASDIDGDGHKEIVFTFVVDSERRSQVEVADWTGTRYAITAAEPGGPADDIRDFQVADLNGDAKPEIGVFQTVGTSGSSVSLWTGASGGRLVPLIAVGDCFNGSNTYGDTGAEVGDRDGDGRAEIRAVCSDPDLPAPLWPTIVYVWRDDRYHCDRRESPDGTTAPCS
ncbi:MAG: VCBS repeat-containing protein [Actinomycetota bacterium]|nr:VCBS repeat-containing protein [Actinomycetota bacterium]